MVPFGLVPPTDEDGDRWAREVLRVRAEEERAEEGERPPHHPVVREIGDQLEVDPVAVRVLLGEVCREWYSSLPCPVSGVPCPVSCLRF